MEEAKFWAVAFVAMVLYGLMVWASYALPVFIGYDSAYPRLRDAITATTETYAWVPSFLAGICARRRTVLLGILTFVGGTYCGYIFLSLDTIIPPHMTHLTWQNPVLWPYQTLLDIALSVVASYAGKNVVFRQRIRDIENQSRMPESSRQQ